jgi:hypothetical protein
VTYVKYRLVLCRKFDFAVKAFEEKAQYKAEPKEDHHGHREIMAGGCDGG